MNLQISVSQLSFGTKGDDVARVHQALLALGRDIPATELKSRALGNGTIAVVKAFQTEAGLPASGVVDAATVRAINAKLAASATGLRVVRGSVFDANRIPFTKGFVQLFRQGVAGEIVIGKSAINADGGAYEISYEIPASTPGRVDLRVAVLSNEGKLVDTSPSGVSILPNAGPLEVVNFVVSTTASAPLTEFELIRDDLQPLLGGRSLADLTEDENRHDVTLLAVESGYPRERVAAMVLAHRLESETKTPAALFYGLLRQGVPAGDAKALHAANPTVRLKALREAVSQGIVPERVGDKKIDDLLAGFKPTAPTELKTLLSPLMNENELSSFLSLYLEDSKTPDAFWGKIAASPALAGRAADLKLTVQLGTLTQNHGPLVNAIRAMPGIKQASDLVRITEAQWTSMITAPGVGVPAGIPGLTPDEQLKNFLQQILRQVEGAFPTQFLAERLDPSPVASFLKSLPSFDIKTTYPEKFFQQNPIAAQTLTSQEKELLRTHRRLYPLTDNAKEAIGLAVSGVRSARQIAAMDVTVFAEEHKDIFSPERATEVHKQARRVSALALALQGQYGAAFNSTGLAALPRLDAQKQKEAATEIPDWETLFGSFDACACQDCASVHGAAAYLVDILHFLADRGVKDDLFERRPDLGDIELSCENTNTVLPYIDLVNEILEQTVSPPPPFSSITLAPELEADLNGVNVTPALTNAFQPSLQPGAHVEVIEDGKRWRVRDEPFTYSIVKQNNALTVIARSRQTAGSSDERRATPQYRNSAAYTELSQAVYPWNLPFDLKTEEGKVFLSQMGVIRADLMEALRPVPKPFDPASPSVYGLAVERLGFTDTERKILTGEALDPPRQPQDFWGSVPVASLTTVQELLDRSGLSYAELDSLLSTWFINPDQSVTVTPKPDAPVDTCDTTRLQVNSLTVDVLSRLHRFVRMWRRTGWRIPELDKALLALAPSANTPALTNEVIVRLDHLNALRNSLRISVLQALALWKTIDTREPDSLYRDMFYNPAIFKPLDEDFLLSSDGMELATTDKLLLDHAPALLAAFRLNAAGLAPLVSRTDGKLNLANLSFLFRHTILARQLGLAVRDLLTAIELTGIDPFNAAESQDSLRFVHVVRSIHDSGFTIAQLDYILRQQAGGSAPFVPTDASLALTLTAMRTDLLKLDNDPEAAVKGKAVVIDHVSRAVALPADVTGDVLGRVKHGGKTGLERFLDLSANTAKELTRGSAPAQFETLEKMLKIALVIRTLKLPASQLDWLFRSNDWLGLAPDTPGAPAPLFSKWYSLIQLQQARRDLGMEDAALEAILAAFNKAAVANHQEGQIAAKQNLVDTLSTWLGWQQADLESLLVKATSLSELGLLDARIPDDYQGIGLLLRLQRAMDLVRRLGVSAAQAGEWSGVSVTDTDDMAIRRAAKAKYEEETWLKAVTPLQNALRDRQREALVSYLVARPEKWTAAANSVDVNDLYANLLIDVEMSSCQLTSRLVQAAASVQLFAQRCLMGMEPGIQTTDPKWEQWQWMKNYRVWEANRKIWLYPENWIEPELRDDKTPFFKDLENELLQSDLDNAAAEQALMRYLEKLEEVAHLEIVGTYEDDENKDVHVFGRTFHTPHIYYYRRREGTTLAWTPWEKVDLDIEGDHLIPVKWNRKLMLIWPVFSEKQDEKEVVMPEPGHKLTGGKRYWEIQLAWSEYQYGRWTGKNLSESVRFEAIQGQPDILFGELVPRPGFTMARIKDTGGIPQPPHPDNDDGDQPPPAQPTSGATGETGPEHLIPGNLVVFKALADGNSLTVRGYLRLDYGGANPSVNSGIAFPFGEFRFFGCRKIVTTATIAQMLNKNFALAPQGTRFDGMGFNQTGRGLTLLDGTFPAGPRMILPTPLADFNERKPLPSDASSTVVNRIDIPVLDGGGSPFRLLAPHQDLQFTASRPFFFIDSARTFMVSSTGASGFRPHPGDWVLGDLAAIGLTIDAPPQTDGANDPADGPKTAVLLPGTNGNRIARELTPMNLSPLFLQKSVLPAFWTTRIYAFQNFYHAYVCDFVKNLDRKGIDGLLSLETQCLLDDQSFEVYKPTPQVMKEYPRDEVEFEAGGGYEMYNWELFFHIPLLIATRLSTNQRFKEAQRWFHYIFNPAGVAGGEFPQRYWQTKPFNERLVKDYEEQAVKFIERLAAEGTPTDLMVAVDVWRADPFNPHAIARFRTTAYQKTTVMKYIDNLIAWGDRLFRQDTLESVNEATQLYVLAAEILGRHQEVIQRDIKPPVETFNTLESRLGALSNALEQIELLIPAPGAVGAPQTANGQPDPPSDSILYFCVQENDRLLGYWDTVADRLLKIRHCMNIEGQVRELPLFAPPIDPALLVRAQAAGLSIGEVLSDLQPSLPLYRFSVILQKANEMAAEVRNLGAGLLAALEKRDAETLSTLRSGQELRLLQAVRDVRENQVKEAQANIDTLLHSQEMTQARKKYYESREKVSALEGVSLLLLGASAAPIEISAHLRVLAGLVKNFGSTKVGSPTTAGIEVGGYFVGVSVDEAAIALEAAASILSIASQATGKIAEYGRRKDEWDHQASLAALELKQIDKQLLAAQIRLAVAEQELRNHDKQIDDARKVDEFLRGKFTNQDLYSYTASQVSSVYFQSYQLAYDMAKKAEQCFRFELGLKDSSYVKFGYWDSLKKGLLSGEKLQYDLRRMETAYLEQNLRDFELTKSISLLLLDPLALVKLRETGKCDIMLPEEIFDLDYAGHYFRRIKSVSLTLPCVVGPYTTISCTLRLLKNSIRINTANGDNGYPRNSDDQGLPAADDRFVENNIPINAIAASSAQNDSGMFEMSFRDERYLPFEGAGAISEWTLELFNDNTPDFGKPLRQFDYGTISDAIMHVKYTAREDAGVFKNAAVAHLRDYFSQAGKTPSLRLFNLRQEFPTEWHRFLNPTDPADGNLFKFDMTPTLFPLRDQGKTLKVNTIWLLARCTDAGDYTVIMSPPLSPPPSPPNSDPNAITLATLPGFGGLHANGENGMAVSGLEIEIAPTVLPTKWQIKMTRAGGGTLTGSEVSELLLVLGYEWKE